MPFRALVTVLAATVVALTACEEPEPAYLPQPRANLAPPPTPDAAETEVARVVTPTPPQIAQQLPAPSDVGAPPADAQVTPSGLASRVLRPGTGTEHPRPDDAVRVHYTGWRSEDGQMFDSSVVRGAPITARLNGVIPGWTEGVPLMVVGEQRRLWIPGNLAYEGRRGPQGMLVFDVELLEIVRAPEAPPHVAAPPPDADHSESGLAWIVLQPGTGSRHPAATDRVEVHYSGWRSEDGELFDSSLMRGQPITTPLDQVIAGWTEGVPLMVEGEKRRFWIPSELAYGNRPGPRGMLVFDIELLRIL